MSDTEASAEAPIPSTAAFTQTGLYHRINSLPNQDVYGFAATERLSALLLADGASCCPQGREGARLAVALAARLLREHEAWFLTVQPGLAAQAVIRELQQGIKAALPSRKRFPAYGCTFAMAVRMGGEVLALSLGDSLLYTVEAGGRLLPLLGQSRPMAGQQPCLLHHAAAPLRCQAVRLALPQTTGLLAATDGCAEALHRLRQQQGHPAPLPWLQAYLHQHPPQDDCTAALLAGKEFVL